MSETKFNIGDKVKTLVKVASYEAVREAGSIGVIKELYEYYCKVVFDTFDYDGYDYWCYKFENLELIDEVTKPTKTQVVVVFGRYVYRDNESPIPYDQCCLSTEIADFLSWFLDGNNYELYKIDYYKVERANIENRSLRTLYEDKYETFNELKEKLIEIIGIDEFNKVFEKIELLNS